jgi:hypothetical protein
MEASLDQSYADKKEPGGMPGFFVYGLYTLVT